MGLPEPAFYDVNSIAIVPMAFCFPGYTTGGADLPPPPPSWGELLAQGTSNLNSPWIVGSVVYAMSAVLLMVTFIGEAVREAFDPRKYSHYE